MTKTNTTKARTSNGRGKGGMQATQAQATTSAPVAAAPEFNSKMNKARIGALKRQITMATRTRETLLKQAEGLQAWTDTLKAEQAQYETA